MNVIGIKIIVRATYNLDQKIQSLPYSRVYMVHLIMEFLSFFDRIRVVKFK